MAVVTFPAAEFTVEGDPGAVRESGRSYARFATVAADAAAGLRSLDAGSWQGSEGEAYRERIAAIPGPLDVAHGAFGEVAAALTGFADILQAAQQRITGIRDDALTVHAHVTQADQARHALVVPTDTDLATDPAAGDRFAQQRADADRRAARLGSEWSELRTVADTVRRGVHEAACQAAARIRAAGRRSPTADQNWLADGCEKTGHWIDEEAGWVRDHLAEHATAMRRIAAVMRVVGIALVVAGAALAAISALAGLATAGIGWLGEIPATELMNVGFALWAGADALDASADWADGTTNGNGLLIDLGWAATSLVPLGRLVHLGTPAARRLATALSDFTRKYGPGSLEHLLTYLRDSLNPYLRPFGPEHPPRPEHRTPPDTQRDHPDPKGGRPAAGPHGPAPASVITEQARRHIFEGELLGKRLVGYHHRPGGLDSGSARVRPGTIHRLGNGCYDATWNWVDESGDLVLNGHGIPRKKWSTFFPDDWSSTRTEAAIDEAFRQAQRRGFAPGTTWFTGTVDGVVIEGRFDATTKKVVTAYPRNPQ